MCSSKVRHCLNLNRPKIFWYVKLPETKEKCMILEKLKVNKLILKTKKNGVHELFIILGCFSFYLGKKISVGTLLYELRELHNMKADSIWCKNAKLGNNKTRKGNHFSYQTKYKK